MIFVNVRLGLIVFVLGSCLGRTIRICNDRRVVRNVAFFSSSFLFSVAEVHTAHTCNYANSYTYEEPYLCNTCLMSCNCLQRIFYFNGG